jgi:hypothetical protein
VSFYGNLQTVADQLISQFGVDVTWTKAARSDYSPGYDLTTTEETSYTVRAVIQTPGAYGDATRPPVIHGKNRTLLIAAKDLEFTPEPNDIVTIEGIEYKVSSCGPTEPGGTDLIWEVVVSR